MHRLLCIILLIACVSLLHATISRAEINLAWNNCITESNQAENIAYACDASRNGLPFRCVVSFVSPDQLNAFVGVEATIDVYNSPAYFDHPTPGPLPDYWRLALGECREGNLLFPASTLGIGSNACRNPWSNANTGGGSVVTSMSNGARLKLTFARDSGTQLLTGQQYIGMVLNIDTWGDINNGNGECAGCCTPMVLSIERVGLHQTAGTPPQDIYYLDPVGGRPWVTWQSPYAPNPPPCIPVPVKRSTWGSIKATYH